MTEQDAAPILEGNIGDNRPVKLMLLLRGVLAHGVLLSALMSKRWRVNYGVDKARRPEQLLAIPFRAKDSPAPRAEFSHPDIIILLTCLVRFLIFVVENVKIDADENYVLGTVILLRRSSRQRSPLLLPIPLQLRQSCWRV